MSCFLDSKKGAILLEIAVGISILAIISGIFVKKTIAARRAMQEHMTKENIETVTLALASFVANNRRLPRPAPDNKGIESNSQRLSGWVPYKSLGISERTAKDGQLRYFVYSAEPALTVEVSRLYSQGIDEDCFCRDIRSPAIHLEGIKSGNIIAFVIDTRESNVEDNHIKIYPTEHTFWISRDMLLMKYLKNSPCLRENNEIFSHTGTIADNDF